ncbi:MAG: ATP-binding cassette domain-containing protein [Deltaproteobacteria bacterium]|nr:ATP-binding cassette domain-containing protein [Deltaproteobacteria bacterium]NIS77103.1 ATP-binding cassette domain-containing protein [Deltaproteobacteria bacterium]
MLEVSHLNVFFQKTHILRDVSLDVGKGSIAGVIGRNGAGKTTLMRTIMGLTKVESGRIVIGGSEVTMEKAHKRPALRVGYMPEDRRLIPDLTVEENVLLPVWATAATGFRNRLEWVYGLMPEVEAMSRRKALQLSGGQLKLVALARALIIGEKLLLLDEPFEGVAPALAMRLAEVLRTLRVEGIAILLSASDDTYSADLVENSFTIERGEIIARNRAGSTNEIE